MMKRMNVSYDTWADYCRGGEAFDKVVQRWEGLTQTPQSCLLFSEPQSNGYGRVTFIRLDNAECCKSSIFLRQFVSDVRVRSISVSALIRP